MLSSSFKPVLVFMLIIVDGGNKQKEIKRKLTPEQLEDLKFATIYSYT